MSLDERELFTRRFDADPDRVWAALRRALATWDLREADDASKTARFDTGWSWTSWGGHMLAVVTPEGEGARLTVSGRPKASLLTTRWGEVLHAREVEKGLVGAVERHISSAP